MLFTATLVVFKHCITTKGEFVSDVAHRIDAFLETFYGHKIFTAACEVGVSEHTLEFLLERTAPMWDNAVRAAARGGHMHVFKWATNRQDGRGPWTADFDNALEVAATHGHLPVVKWLYERGIDTTDRRYTSKSSPGYVEASCRFQHSTANALELAASNGHLEILKWLMSVAGPERTTGEAVKNEHFVKWFHDAKVSVCSSCMAQAARNGHFEVMKWLHENQSAKCTTRAIDEAAANGHLEVVKWLHENLSLKCSSSALRMTIEAGHVEMANWLSGKMCEPFVYKGSASTLAASCTYGTLEYLEWLNEHFPTVFSTNAMDNAAEAGDLIAVKWLHQHRNEGCTDNALRYAATHGHLEILQFLHTHYSDKFSSEVMNGAIDNGHLEVIQWLHANRHEVCITINAVIRAARGGHLNVVLWLLEHRSKNFSDVNFTTARNIEVLCSFEKIQGKYIASTIQADSGELDLLLTVFKELPALLRGCFRWLAEFAVDRGNVEILTWLNQFGLQLLTADPIRDAVCRGDVKLLQWFHWFHWNGFAVDDPDLLEQAIESGRVNVTRWLWKHGYDITVPGLIEKAAESRNVWLLRWLIEQKLTLDLDTARVAAFLRIDVLWWLSETDRVELVLSGLSDDNERKLLWWVLVNTRFENESSRAAIRTAISEAPESVHDWVKANLSGSEAYAWCFSADGTSGNAGKEEHDLRPTKRPRSVL